MNNKETMVLKKFVPTDFEVICIDCEEQWYLDCEPPHCICEDPAPDGWLLYIKDNNGQWVKNILQVIDSRYT